MLPSLVVVLSILSAAFPSCLVCIVSALLPQVPEGHKHEPLKRFKMLQNRRETRVLRLILAHAVHTGRTFLRLGFAIVNIVKAHSCALSKYTLALCRAYNGTLPPLRDVDAHKVEGKAPKGAGKNQAAAVCLLCFAFCFASCFASCFVVVARKAKPAPDTMP